MFYKEIAPHSEIEKIIKCIWTLKHDYCKEFHTYEHLWADVYAELIFTFGNPYYLKTDSGIKVLPKIFFIGTFKKELKLYSDGLTSLVAIRFQPWGVFPFSIHSPAKLVNNILPAEEVFGSGITMLNKKLKQKSWEKNIEILQNYFQKEFSSNNKIAVECIPIASEIIAKKGIISISGLSRQFNINPRQLERLFKNEIGLPAKIFSRIIRFNYAKRLIERNPKISLAELTYETGYSDQSHFGKNFREFFDISPAEFKKQMKDFMKNFSNFNIDVGFLPDR